ncbi:hypothetical protein [Anaerophilus nitritogenes]|uniref:hypothetical protein n=1 Tax=Anaerophilus nitritogenes TaxID=2498136 RepID=UPI00101CC87B|nr:hypothetical protein [Anaerophilus nitritogenes]
MKNRFFSGMIAGSMLGMTTGVYAYKKMSPRQRRMVMKRGKRFIKNATDVIDMVQSMSILR